MVKSYAHAAVFILLSFLMIQNAQAQISKPGITLGGYLLYSKPKGSFENSYKFGGGGEIFGGVGLGKSYVIATAGFSQFKPVSASHEGSLTYTPVKIGLKRFLFKRILFVNADVGRATVKNQVFNVSRFTRGVGVGAKLLGLEAGLYYDGWKKVNSAGYSNTFNVKVGMSLGL